MGSAEIPDHNPDESPELRNGCARISYNIMHEVQTDMGADIQPYATMTEHVLERTPHLNFYIRDYPETIWWCESLGQGVCNVMVFMEGKPDRATFTVYGECASNRRLREAFDRARKAAFGPDARGWDEDEVE